MRGTALWIALGVAVVLVLATVWASLPDIAAKPERDTLRLDVLTITMKLACAAGLVVLGRRLQSRSYSIIALLFLLLVVGNRLLDAGWFNALMDRVGAQVARVFPVSSGFAELASLFFGLAVVVGGLLLAAWRMAAPGERWTVATLLGLVAMVGVFAGPVNAVSALGINWEWLFAEDFGQSLSMALVTGYVAGLLAATGD